jgi:hypothetical protein
MPGTQVVAVQTVVMWQVIGLKWLVSFSELTKLH